MQYCISDSEHVSNIDRDDSDQSVVQESTLSDDHLCISIASRPLSPLYQSASECNFTEVTNENVMKMADDSNETQYDEDIYDDKLSAFEESTSSNLCSVKLERQARVSCHLVELHLVNNDNNSSHCILNVKRSADSSSSTVSVESDDTLDISLASEWTSTFTTDEFDNSRRSDPRKIKNCELNIRKAGPVFQDQSCNSSFINDTRKPKTVGNKSKYEWLTGYPETNKVCNPYSSRRAISHSVSPVGNFYSDTDDNIQTYRSCTFSDRPHNNFDRSELLEHGTPLRQIYKRHHFCRQLSDEDSEEVYGYINEDSPRFTGDRRRFQDHTRQCQNCSLNDSGLQMQTFDTAIQSIPYSQKNNKKKNNGRKIDSYTHKNHLLKSTRPLRKCDQLINSCNKKKNIYKNRYDNVTESSFNGDRGDLALTKGSSLLQPSKNVRFSVGSRQNAQKNVNSIMSLNEISDKLSSIVDRLTNKSKKYSDEDNRLKFADDRFREGNNLTLNEQINENSGAYRSRPLNCSRSIAGRCDRCTDCKGTIKTNRLYSENNIQSKKLPQNDFRSRMRLSDDYSKSHISVPRRRDGDNCNSREINITPEESYSSKPRAGDLGDSHDSAAGARRSSERLTDVHRRSDAKSSILLSERRPGQNPSLGDRQSRFMSVNNGGGEHVEVYWDDSRNESDPDYHHAQMVNKQDCRKFSSNRSINFYIKEGSNKYSEPVFMKQIDCPQNFSLGIRMPSESGENVASVVETKEDAGTTIDLFDNASHHLVSTELKNECKSPTRGITSRKTLNSYPSIGRFSNVSQNSQHAKSCACSNRGMSPRIAISNIKRKPLGSSYTQTSPCRYSTRDDEKDYSYENANLHLTGGQCSHNAVQSSLEYCQMDQNHSPLHDEDVYASTLCQNTNSDVHLQRDQRSIEQQEDSKMTMCVNDRTNFSTANSKVIVNHQNKELPQHQDTTKKVRKATSNQEIYREFLNNTENKDSDLRESRQTSTEELPCKKIVAGYREKYRDSDFDQNKHLESKRLPLTTNPGNENTAVPKLRINGKRDVTQSIFVPCLDSVNKQETNMTDETLGQRSSDHNIRKQKVMYEQTCPLRSNSSPILHPCKCQKCSASMPNDSDSIMNRNPKGQSTSVTTPCDRQLRHHNGNRSSVSLRNTTSHIKGNRQRDIPVSHRLGFSNEHRISENLVAHKEYPPKSKKTEFMHQSSNESRQSADQSSSTFFMCPKCSKVLPKSMGTNCQLLPCNAKQSCGQLFHGVADLMMHLTIRHNSEVEKFVWCVGCSLLLPDYFFNAQKPRNGPGLCVACTRVTHTRLVNHKLPFDKESNTNTSANYIPHLTVRNKSINLDVTSKDSAINNPSRKSYDEICSNTGDLRNKKHGDKSQSLFSLQQVAKLMENLNSVNVTRSINKHINIKSNGSEKKEDKETKNVSQDQNSNVNPTFDSKPSSTRPANFQTPKKSEKKCKKKKRSNSNSQKKCKLKAANTDKCEEEETIINSSNNSKRNTECLKSDATLRELLERGIIVSSEMYKRMSPVTVVRSGCPVRKQDVGHKGIRCTKLQDESPKILRHKASKKQTALQ